MAELKTSVSGLTAPTRNGMDVTATWKVPAKAKKNGAKDSVRFDGQDMLWVYDADPKTKGRKKGKGDVIDRDNTNKDSQKKDTETIPRKEFYPFAGKPKLLLAEFWVRGYNIQGTGNKAKRHYGPWKHKQLAFAAPAAPKSCSLTYDDENGTISGTFTTDAPAGGGNERYDTLVWLDAGGEKKQSGASYTQASKTVGPYEVPSARNLGIGEFKKCSMAVKNRGFAGDSGTVNATPYYVCHPAPPTCGEPALVYAEEGVFATAMVRVPIDNVGIVYDGKTAIRPANVRLERLKNSNSATDASGAAAGDWSPVTTDNGATNGLSDTWANAVSDQGKHTWYRAVAIRDGYETPGVPVCATALDVLSSSTVVGAAHIDSLEAGADGKSAIVTLSGKDVDDTGYEVSWSSAEDAWQSTDPPDTFETTESSLVIKGLKEGVRYYVQARAYELNSDGEPVYGEYSGISDVTPVTTPSVVYLNGAQVTPRGSALALTWTYDTDATQLEWRLVDSSGNVVKAGEGASCATAITPGDYGDASTLTYHVELTTGGGWKASDERTFAIADAPTCTLSTSATLTAQPVGLTVASDTGDTVTVSVTALGSTGSGLDGDADQMAGDTVHAATYTPTWGGTPRSATVTLPTGLALWDDAEYRVRVTVTDNATGLESEPATADFAVDWTHKAMQPVVSVTRDADLMTATVTVDAPADYARGDRFDLYRMTADGERLIASAQPFGTTIVDRLAPFSHDGENLAYLAATRTADGSVCVSEDASYHLVSKSLRLDWNDRSIELPYNLGLSDEFAKDSEVRKHLDGTSQAYWNEGVTRKASLDTALIRLEDAEQQALLRDMLQHSGSVFVRTPDGLAFAADVQPGTIERTFDSGAVSVSLEAYEHALTDEGRPGKADISQPEWNGGGVEVTDGIVYDAEGGFPMDDWSYIGTANGTVYVCDPDGHVRTDEGTLMSGWTWDGETLYDENDEPVEVE